MTTQRDLWLDADRESGETRIVLTAEHIRAAHEHRLLHGGGRPAQAYGSPISLLSHRAFEVTALGYESEAQDMMGSLTVIRGCFENLTVSFAVLREGAETPGVPPRWPLRGPWPTRLFNPPRQNLSFRFDGSVEPGTVTVHWRHIGKPLGEAP